MSQEDFDAIDTDGDGFITPTELIKALPDLSELPAEELIAIMTTADANGDGKIDYDEYCKLVG